MEFEVVISTGNQLKVDPVAHGPLGGSIEFSVAVYDYDPAQKKFFLAFRGAADGSALNGRFAKLALNSSPATPQLPCELVVGVTPQPSAQQGIVASVQEIAFATSATASSAKQWGVIELHQPDGSPVSTGFGGPGSDR